MARADLTQRRERRGGAAPAGELAAKRVFGDGDIGVRGDRGRAQRRELIAERGVLEQRCGLGNEPRAERADKLSVRHRTG